MNRQEFIKFLTGSCFVTPLMLGKSEQDVFIDPDFMMKQEEDLIVSFMDGYRGTVFDADKNPISDPVIEANLTTGVCVVHTLNKEGKPFAVPQNSKSVDGKMVAEFVVATHENQYKAPLKFVGVQVETNKPFNDINEVMKDVKLQG